MEKLPIGVILDERSEGSSVLGCQSRFTQRPRSHGLFSKSIPNCLVRNRDYSFCKVVYEGISWYLLVTLMMVDGAVLRFAAT